MVVPTVVVSGVAVPSVMGNLGPGPLVWWVTLALAPYSVVGYLDPGPLVGWITLALPPGVLGYLLPLAP